MGVLADGPGPPPEPPPVPKDTPAANQLDLLKAQYTQELSAWQTAWTQQVTAEATETALVATTAAAQHLADATVAATAKAVTVAAEVTAEALDATREGTDVANEAALFKSVHDAYVATTQASLDRSLTRVNVVTAAVGSITTLYTGLIALVYTTKANAGKPLSLVAIVPALYLALALFLITIYAAMFKKTLAVGPLLPTGIGGQIAELRLVTYMRWCFAGVLNRAWALHAGIVSMGIGIATLPLPFVNLRGGVQVAIVAVGAALVAGTGWATYNNNRPPKTRDAAGNNEP
jgi:hypothetical protein